MYLWKRSNVNTDTALLHTIKTSDSVKQFTVPANTVVALQAKLDTLTPTREQDNPETRALVLSLLSDLLYALMPKQPPKEEKHPAWFNQLMLRFNDIEYLQGGIPKLMENLNYNQIYINRIFKKTMGMSIGTHLNETRLQFALTYLKTSNLSINDISEILGFSSPSFFYKKFREKYGITPNDYRTNIFKDKHIVL